MLLCLYSSALTIARERKRVRRGGAASQGKNPHIIALKEDLWMGFQEKCLHRSPKTGTTPNPSETEGSLGGLGYLKPTIGYSDCHKSDIILVLVGLPVFDPNRAQPKN